MFIGSLVSLFLLAGSQCPYIDPSIQGPERELMQSVMQPLGSDFTGDAIFIDADGKPHVNKPSIQVKVGTPVKGSSDYQWPGGERFTPPTELTQNSGPPSPSTDPYIP